MINKIIIIRIIEVFALFVISALCCSVRANQLESYLENLRKDIGQKKPAYAIAVTRIINKTGRSYAPIPVSSRFVIFSILNRFLGKQYDIKFKTTLADCIDIEIEQYIKVIKKCEKYKEFFSKNSFFLGEREVRYGNIVKRQKKNAKSWEEYIQDEINLAAQSELEEEERKLMAFWEENKKEIEKAKKLLIQKYCTLYDSINLKLLTFSDQNHREATIKDSDKAIVVFNEMFFGKSAPFNKGVIEGEVAKCLSLVNPDKVFHVNFLTLEERFFENVGMLRAFTYENSGDYTRFNTGIKFDVSKEEVLDSETEKRKNYEAYVKSVYTNIANIYTFEHQLYRRVPLKILENASRIYLNGNEEASYNKGSYQMEDDDSLKKGVFYVFGKGTDKPRLSNNKIVSEYLYDLYLKILKSPLIPSYISTEICYDLELGVRHKCNLYPEDLKMHIVPSNTLTFRDNPENGNMKNLPCQSYFIFHVDPKEAALYKKIPTLFENYKLGFQAIGDGMCSYIYSFELGDNMYYIKVWDFSLL